MGSKEMPCVFWWVWFQLVVVDRSERPDPEDYSPPERTHTFKTTRLVHTLRQSRASTDDNQGHTQTLIGCPTVTIEVGKMTNRVRRPQPLTRYAIPRICLKEPQDRTNHRSCLLMLCVNPFNPALTEEGNSAFLGQGLPASRGEEVDGLEAGGTLNAAHVLHQTDNRQLQLLTEGQLPPHVAQGHALEHEGNQFYRFLCMCVCLCVCWSPHEHTNKTMPPKFLLDQSGT